MQTLRFIHRDARRIVPLIASGCGLAVVLTISLADCCWSADEGVGRTSAPSGWTTKAPRDEIRPHFAYRPKGGRSGKGGFVIEADQRPGLHGWWVKTYQV